MAGTLEAWINPSVVSGVRSIILKMDSSYVNTDYYLRVYGGRLDFEWYNNGWNGVVEDTPSIEASKWAHVVVTFDGSAVKLYVNGVLKKQGSQTSAVLTGTGNVEIGLVKRATPVNIFEGIIDEVRIYNRALSEEEIKENYDSKASNYQVVLEYGKIVLTGNLRLGKGTYKLCIEKIGELNNKPLVKITIC
jgi:hypothetical protein